VQICLKHLYQLLKMDVSVNGCGCGSVGVE
jgi:hypothetical protein